MKSYNSLPFIAFLIALSVSGPLSINFYLALLPEMASSLSTNAATMQQTVSIYLIGFACAQLIVGPLSDKFGRRPILITCYALFSLASLVCAFASDASLLIIGRLIQSLGGCAGVLISRTIVRDVFTPKEMGKIMSYMITGFSMAPLMAPAIGGFIGVYYGWRSLFLILAGVGFSLMLWTYLGFKETNKNLNPKATQIKHILKNYVFLLSNKHFLCYFLIVSASVAGVLTYTSASSFVLIEVLDVPAQYYGLLFSITALGMFLGGLISAKLIRQRGSELAVWYGCLLLLSGGIILAALPLLGLVSILTLTGSMFVYALGNGVVMPSAMTLAIMPFPQKAGAAAALIGCSQSALGALCGYIAGMFYDKTAIPMNSIIGLMSLLAFSGILYIRISQKREGRVV
jgi:DHA1 family bicyclomycin/chloramphenicol resistance-like MFS transporter